MKILISTIFQDAGDATRAIKMADIIRRYSLENLDLDIAIVSRGSKFEKLAISSGFRIIHALPKNQYHNFHDEYSTHFGDLIGDLNFAKKLLISETTVYETEKPDVILNGFFPISTIARKAVLKNSIGISFLPLPLVKNYITEIKKFSEEMVLSNLPNFLQSFIMQHISLKLKLNNPAIKHKTIARAAKELGYTQTLNNIFDMLESDYYFINDYSDFYNTSKYPNNMTFSGLLISQQKNDTLTDSNVLKILSSKNNRKKFFCSLGSVGDKDALFEIIKVFNSKHGKKYSGIILAPKEICKLEDAGQILDNSHVYITDQFVPAKMINDKVDIVICHGGQGTLQTAILSGTPVIGVVMQPEQDINLQHLSDYGAAIQIKKSKWSQHSILKSIETILATDSFEKKMLILKNKSNILNTEHIIGTTFWEFLVKKNIL